MFARVFMYMCVFVFVNVCSCKYVRVRVTPIHFVTKSGIGNKRLCEFENKSHYWPHDASKHAKTAKNTDQLTYGATHGRTDPLLEALRST